MRKGAAPKDRGGAIPADPPGWRRERDRRDGGGGKEGRDQPCRTGESVPGRAGAVSGDFWVPEPLLEPRWPPVLLWLELPCPEGGAPDEA